MILVIVSLSLHRAPDLFEHRLKEPKQIGFHVRRQARWRWLDGVEQVWRFAPGGDWHRLAPASGNRTANSLGARKPRARAVGLAHTNISRFRQYKRSTIRTLSPHRG